MPQLRNAQCKVGTEFDRLVAGGRAVSLGTAPTSNTVIASALAAPDGAPRNQPSGCVSWTGDARRKPAGTDLLDLGTIDFLTNGRLGVHDVICPLCVEGRSHHGRARRVLRIWRYEPGWAGFYCARCDARGYASDRSAPQPDAAKLARARQEADERERESVAERLALARWLWCRRQPIARSVAEKYLCEVRCYTGPIPATLGFLPARRQHPPAMIAAFAWPIAEPEPGRIEVAGGVQGVHLTKLKPDGTGKADVDAPKITVGKAFVGVPLVAAAVNDLGGLGMSEGIEDALSLHEATRMGSWASGSAARLPALAASVPNYVEAVTIAVDDDDVGRRGAAELTRRLVQRGIEVRWWEPRT
jgi:hypothetical protein